MDGNLRIKTTHAEGRADSVCCAAMGKEGTAGYGIGRRKHAQILPLKLSKATTPPTIVSRSTRAKRRLLAGNTAPPQASYQQGVVGGSSECWAHLLTGVGKLRRLKLRRGGTRLDNCRPWWYIGRRKESAIQMARISAKTMRGAGARHPDGVRRGGGEGLRNRCGCLILYHVQLPAVGSTSLYTIWRREEIRAAQSDGARESSP